MPSKVSALANIDEKLKKVAAIIAQPSKIERTRTLLYEAYKELCGVDGHDLRDAEANQLYDLYENLESYYDDNYVSDDEDDEDEDNNGEEDNGSLSFLTDIVNGVRAKIEREMSRSTYRPQIEDEEENEDDEDEDEDDEEGDEEEEEDEEGDDDSYETRDESREIKYSYLSKDEIDNKIKTVFSRIKINRDYYSIDNEISRSDLNKQKWKTYLYLRECVLHYRRGNQTELLQLINFLEADVKNKEWLTKKLLDNPKKHSNEFWSSGSHEWLERSLIVDVLRRSAGMIHGVQAETEFRGEHPDIDWLYVQAQLRSPTKYLFFRLPSDSIKEGHVGAVKTALEGGTFSSKGSPAFHKKLEEAFQESTTLAGFIIRIHNIFKLDVISGKKYIAPDDEKRYVVDSSPTSEAKRIEEFRRTKLRIYGYDQTNQLMKNLIKSAADKPLDEYSVSPVASESSDSEGEITRKLHRSLTM